MALTAFTPNADAASTIAPFSVVILAFFSGICSRSNTAELAGTVGHIFPLYHLAVGLQTTLAPGATGLGLSADNVAVLGAWGIAALFTAARRFHWEPQASRG